MRTQTFDDFDAFAASIRDVDSKMLLRNPNQRTWSVSSVDLGRIDVQLGKLGSGNIAQGQLRPDGYMLYLPLTDGVEYTANGQVLGPSTFAILEPGCEFCISTRVEHDWCVAFVPTKMLQPDSGAPASGSCYVSNSQPLAAHRFRETLLEIFSTAGQCAPFESSRAAGIAAEEVLHLARQVVPTTHPEELHGDGRPRFSRDKIVVRCMELMDQQRDRPLTVRDLVATSGVSERTLRSVFNEYFGIGPSQYLQLRHLHTVRRALREAESDDTTVSQVLVEHGEWAFSRFASRYQKLFGERPSQTLRASYR